MIACRCLAALILALALALAGCRIVDDIPPAAAPAPLPVYPIEIAWVAGAQPPTEAVTELSRRGRLELVVWPPAEVEPQGEALSGSLGVPAGQAPAQGVYLMRVEESTVRLLRWRAGGFEELGSWPRNTGGVR